MPKPKPIVTTDPKLLDELREQNPNANIIVAEPGKVRVLHEPGRKPRLAGFAR